MSDLIRLRSVVARHLGLGLEEVRDPELQTILERRMAAQRMKRPAQYLDLLDGSSGREEAIALGQLLTVGETFFFRGAAQFRVLRETILPALWRKQNDVHVLSAACSSGEEPYSLAMMFHDEGWDGTRRSAHIDAVDLDRRSLAKAAAGIYSTWSLRETTPALRKRWFVPQGQSFKIAPEIQGQVHFHNRNLLELDALFEPASFDLVLCRNALMYMTPESIRAVVDKIEALLVPGGYFFVSDAETLRGITDRFELMTSDAAFYYRRPLVGEVAWRPITPSPPPVASRPAPAAISPAPPAVTSGSAEEGLVAVRGLFERERFAEALVLLGTIVVTPDRADDLAIYRAAAQLGVGATADAEATARTVIVEGTRPADAHMVVALAAEHRADNAKARAHHHSALYLDPAFALARLHLGRIDRREGKLVDARRELRQALELLGHESEVRLVLFGGGFSREGLVALCKSELTLVEKAAAR